MCSVSSPEFIKYLQFPHRPWSSHQLRSLNQGPGFKSFCVYKKNPQYFGHRLGQLNCFSSGKKGSFFMA